MIDLTFEKVKKLLNLMQTYHCRFFLTSTLRTLVNDNQNKVSENKPLVTINKKQKTRDLKILIRREQIHFIKKNKKLSRCSQWYKYCKFRHSATILSLHFNLLLLHFIIIMATTLTPIQTFKFTHSHSPSSFPSQPNSTTLFFPPSTSRRNNNLILSAAATSGDTTVSSNGPPPPPSPSRSK